MVDVFVRQKNFAHVLPIKARVFELTKNSTTAAAINQKIFIAVAYHKASVVTFRDERIARAEHCEFQKIFSP